MARGHWRNWDETACEGCGNPIYQKYGKKHKGMAHFFSAISGMGKQNQIILHIDTRKLDQSAMKKRALFATDAEILYHKNIPASAIIKVETVYVARKQEVT